jgi:hypothetical protein
MKGGKEVLNDLVWSVFQGYKKAKDERCPYKELENSWRLYEVDELEELRQQAITKEQIPSSQNFQIVCSSYSTSNTNVKIIITFLIIY